MDLLDKLRAVAGQAARVPPGLPVPFQTVLDEAQGPCEAVIDERPTLMFGSNNYFGLSTHPEVVAAAGAALARHGTGTTGSRIANGTLRIHAALEAQFAAHFGKRHARVFTTGYQANLSVVTALCGPGDVVVLDADSHASLVDAARLSRADVLWVRHNDVGGLRAKLGRLPAGHTNRLVVVEGVYSIRGDVAALPGIVDACRAHGAYLLIDEAHSFGMFGDRGLGCAEAQGVLDQADFVVGTFSKALGSVGGFCVSDHEELEALHFSARPYMFTASGAPATIAGVSAALGVLQRDPSLKARLWARTRRLRAGLQRLGYTIGPTESPIVAIFAGHDTVAYGLWHSLLAAGVYVNIVLPPGCPAGQCLLRASASALHTDAQVDQALDAFAEVGRRFGPPRGELS